ncbi:MAG: RsmD family RNA methyltransferase, partial [Paracoccaceae bacterium]
LEAISRGASHATLVDDGNAARTLLRRNIALMRAEDSATYLRRDATKLGPLTGTRFDLVFLDPPYGKTLGEAALSSALHGNWLAPEALIVWEESTPPTPPAGFNQLDQRRYGDTLVTILRAP